MKSATVMAIVFVTLSPSMSFLESATLAYRDPAESRGARLANLIHEFDDHRISDPLDSMILYGQEGWSFRGATKDLNRFLKGLAQLPQAQDLVIRFTGPEPIPFGEPLTAAAAQATVDYDWRVRVLQGRVSVLVPLAKEIPFAHIQVPSQLRTSADVGSPRIAKSVCKTPQRATTTSVGRQVSASGYGELHNTESPRSHSASEVRA